MTYKFVSVKQGSGRCGSKRKESLLKPNSINDHRRTDGVRVSKPLRTCFFNRQVSEVQIVKQKHLENHDISENDENSITGDEFTKGLSDDMIKSIFPKLMDNAADRVSFDSAAVDAIKKACAAYVAKVFHEIDVCEVKIIKAADPEASSSTASESQ